MAESNAFIGFDGFYYVFVNNTGSFIKNDQDFDKCYEIIEEGDDIQWQNN